MRLEEFLIMQQFQKIQPHQELFNYKCPSAKSFQQPLVDIKITDTLKRQILKLPEVNKKKIVFDPLLFQIEKKLPEFSLNNINSPMQCKSPIFSEIKWRKRGMNKKKRMKYQKKMFYVIKRNKQAKEKRYQTILSLYEKMNIKKVESFDPLKFINRELEKAKFYGYKCDSTYNNLRNNINSIKSFDSKFFKKFIDPKLPIHMLFEK